MECSASQTPPTQGRNDARGTRKRDEGNPQSRWVIWRLPLFREQTTHLLLSEAKEREQREREVCGPWSVFHIQQSLTTSMITLTILHILTSRFLFFSLLWFPCFLFSSSLLDACCNVGRREADVVLTPDADPWISREVRRRDDTRGWWEREDGWQASWDENTCRQGNERTKKSINQNTPTHTHIHNHVYIYIYISIIHIYIYTYIHIYIYTYIHCIDCVYTCITHINTMICRI